MLTKDQILKATDLDKEKVEVPEWGGEVYVSAMTAADRDSFEAGMMASEGDTVKKYQNMRARLAALTIVDEDGERMFGDKEAAALGRKSAAAMTRVFAVACRLNGIGDRDVEELTGN